MSIKKALIAALTVSACGVSVSANAFLYDNGTGFGSDRPSTNEREQFNEWVHGLGFTDQQAAAYPQKTTLLNQWNQMQNEKVYTPTVSGERAQPTVSDAETRHNEVQSDLSSQKMALETNDQHLDVAQRELTELKYKSATVGAMQSKPAVVVAQETAQNALDGADQNANLLNAEIATRNGSDAHLKELIDGQDKTQANRDRTANQHVSPDAGQATQTANDADQQQQIDGLSKTLANQQRTASQHVTATSTPATVTPLTGASKKELKAEQVARERADYQQKQAAYAQRQDIDLNSYHTQVNRAAIENNQQAIVSNTQHLDSLEKRQNQQDKTIKDNDKRASAGISAAFAMASIPQVTESQQFGLGAGAGTYNSESAVSVGASFHATSNTIVKLNVSADTESNFGAGVGASVGWQ